MWLAPRSSARLSFDRGRHHGWVLARLISSPSLLLALRLVRRSLQAFVGITPLLQHAHFDPHVSSPCPHWRANRGPTGTALVLVDMRPALALTVGIG